MSGTPFLPTAVIFDLGGTIVDFGCLAPMAALRGVFADHGIDLSDDELRGPMGLGKLDHIRALLALPRTVEQWRERNGTAPDDAVAHRLHEDFVPRQTAEAAARATTIPGFDVALEWCRENGAGVGVTTGYPRAVAVGILERLAPGFVPEVSVCTDEVDRGRPAPDMLLAAMRALDVAGGPERVVAVGDTVPDVQAARTAGCRAVAVVDGGSEIGLDAATFDALTDEERATRRGRATHRLQEAGADAVVHGLAELPMAIVGLG